MRRNTQKQLYKVQNWQKEHKQTEALHALLEKKDDTIKWHRPVYAGPDKGGGGNGGNCPGPPAQEGPAMTVLF